MNKQYKGGRPSTGRENAITVRISDESVRMLESERNKSELIDNLIRGKVARIQCPHCGEIITIKTEE